MTQPSLKVIGVYRPVISEETWQEQFQVTEDEQATREHFEGLVLRSSGGGTDRTF